jgi:maltose O-acetyltransferase
MLRGEDYLASDPELTALRDRAKALTERFNAAPYDRRSQREEILGELLGEIGEDSEVLTGFRCDYGAHITIGARVFVNFDCVMLDVAPITIGDHCQLATKVQLLTPTHPVDPVRRREGWEGGRPITLGENVWLGGGVIVCPGVTIGDDTVVGAGAVVVDDLPAGVLAVGNPARIVRELA